MKNKLKSVKYFLNNNSWILYITGFILSLVGSFQVYHGKFDSILKEFSVIVISVLKLFLFSPTEGFLNPQPLAYELAVWIAPAGTVLASFSVFKRLYTAITLKIGHFNRKHIIVMGLNDYSMMFMKNFKNSSTKKKLLCVLPETTGATEIENLHRKGILTATIDYMSGNSEKNIRTAKEFNFSSVDTILCFHQEPRNYGYVKIISELIEPKKNIDVYMCIKSKRIQNMAQHEMDKISFFDIHYFNIFDLISNDLVNNKKFKFYSTEGLKADWNNHTLNSTEDISDLIGIPHILLIGFSEFGKSIIGTASNQSVINVKKNMQITVVDLRANSLIDEYRSGIRGLDNVMDINIIHGDIVLQSVQEKILKIHSRNPFTSIVFATKNTLPNLVFLDLVGDILCTVPVALYCENLQEIGPLVEAVRGKYTSLTVFGQLPLLLNYDTIVNETLDTEAKNFNASYNKLSATIFGESPSVESPGEQWNKLSSIKKDSNRSQSMHKNIKRVILQKITEIDGYPDTIEELLALWRKKIENLSVPEKINIIEKDLFMNYLCALEHKRWNNFYYMKNFIYSETKDEVKRTHNCLVDDWGEFIKGSHRNTVIYDFLSVLNNF